MSLLEFAKSIWGFCLGKEKPDPCGRGQAAVGWGRLGARRRGVGVLGEESRGSGRCLLLFCGIAARRNQRTNE